MVGTFADSANVGPEQHGATLIKIPSITSTYKMLNVYPNMSHLRQAKIVYAYNNQTRRQGCFTFLRLRILAACHSFIAGASTYEIIIHNHEFLSSDLIHSARTNPPILSIDRTCLIVQGGGQALNRVRSVWTTQY